MNKYILAAAVVFVGFGWIPLRAGQIMTVPEADSNQSVISADYGGVDYSSSNFTTNFTTVGTGRFRVYGVLFSSGNTSDFVQIYDTGSWASGAIGGISTETVRVFNIANSSGGVNNSASYSSSGFSSVGPRPLRFKYGLGWRVSTNAYSSVTLLYWKEQ